MADVTPVFQISGLSKAYGARSIFSDADVIISRNQKIGVIGRNGAGKSTLFRILAGQEEADSGTIFKDRHARVAVLDQHDPFQEDEVALDFLLRRTGKEEWECRKIGHRFLLDDKILESRARALAGGLRMRVRIAALLLADPDFLLLDEPTNYLDLKTLVLMESFLRTFRGGALVISHDREFLKRTCMHTLEVAAQGLRLYPGNVEEYLRQKREESETVERFNKNVEARRKELQTFVTRFGAKASKAAQARSKQKQLDRLATMDIDEPTRTIRLRIPQGERKTGPAFKARDLAIGYPGKQIATGIEIDAKRGEHIAVLGDNGQGKSTFLRTIAGDLAPISGEFKWGHEIKVAYYAQHVYEALSGNETVLSALEARAVKGVTRQHVLDLAGSFLFQGDEVKKSVSVLSGGERSRLLLAGMLLSRPDVLLLDEPTNHLDFETVEALGHALKDYPGTIFFVSHDRTFVNLVATSIVEVGGGSVRAYPGTYPEYVYRLEMEAEDAADEDKSDSGQAKGGGKRAKESVSRESVVAAASTPVPTISGTGSAVAQAEGPRQNVHKKRKLDRAAMAEARAQLKAIDLEMRALEKEKSTLLGEVEAGKAAGRETYDRLDEVIRKLAELEERWLELTETVGGSAGTAASE